MATMRIYAEVGAMSKEVERTKADKAEEELRTLFGQAESLRQQINTLDTTILDIATVIETLDFIKDNGKDKTVLVPIGAGNFIRARIVDTQNVIMGVGGRLSIEANIEEARKVLTERMKVLEDLRLDLRRRLEEINAKISKLVSEIQQKA